MGIRDGLREAFLKALSEDFSKHGQELIEDLRKIDKAQYLRLLSGLQAETAKAASPDDTASLGHLSDEELDARIEEALAHFAAHRAEGRERQEAAPAATEAEAPAPDGPAKEE